MSQCVPSWDIEENRPSNRLPHDGADAAQGYEVAELTWENGQLAMHGLAPHRVVGKPIPSKYPWEKPRASGTLEAIVNQAAKLVAPLGEPHVHGDELVPWFDPPRSVAPGTMAMDALVPSHLDPEVQACVTGKSTRVESCGGTASMERGKEVEGGFVRKRSRAARAVPAHDGCSRNQSVSFSETFGRESRHVGVDSCEMDVNTGFTSTSLGSDTNPNTPESVSHRGPQKKSRTEEEKSTRNEKSTISTKRSRAAAIHNQSERKRRDKINQKMKTLQKMVPNSSKTDKASMLDEVIEYLKTLQAQVQMMNMMNMPHMNMMMPTLNMQQQLQMAMMAQMGMGMGMGAMDVNTMGRAPNIGLGGMPQVLNPAAFMPMAAAWDGANDRGPVLPDPMASFLACQAQQPMTMDAYRRMAAMQQQLQQQQQASKP